LEITSTLEMILATLHEGAKNNYNPKKRFRNKHLVVAGLDRGGQQVRDVPLMRLDVPLEVRVEVEQQQLVHADHAGDDVHHHQLHLQ
jgi:hypothetical protein